MLPPLIDTHCHLDVSQFDTDRDQLMVRAGEGGVRAMLTLGTDLLSSGRSLELADAHDSIYAAVGLHPNDAIDDGPVDWWPYQEMADHSRVICWGEIGLDNHWDTVAPDRQQRVLRDQLAIARDMQLPVALHIRKAHPETLAILSEPPFKDVTGVLHCWSGDLDEAKKGIDLGYLIGIGGPVTYNKSILPQIVAELPWDALVVETDSPYLAPVPRRGKRNEPALVRHTFDRLVEIKGDLDPDVAAERLWNNFRRIFTRFNVEYPSAART